MNRPLCLPSSAEIKEQALALGFDDAAITDASLPEEDLQSWQEWLARGLHGPALYYMQSELRLSLQNLLEDAKTVIIAVTNYKQPFGEFEEGKGVIASYARGKDYHQLHRKRLKKLKEWLEDRVGQKEIARPFSDSKPILEKCLAVKAGLGWFGKNTLLIHRRFGTTILLAGLLTKLELEHPSPLSTREMRCGTCTRCLDACPTQALIAPYLLDAKKCLSYHLIESKEEVPSDIAKKNPGYLFGCDICQKVCPHNVRSPLATEEAFGPQNGVGASLSYEEIEALASQPERLYGTPLKRRAAEGLLYTLKSLQSARQIESEG